MSSSSNSDSSVSGSIPSICPFITASLSSLVTDLRLVRMGAGIPPALRFVSEQIDHQIAHQTRDVANGRNRPQIGHSRWSEHAKQSRDRAIDTVGCNNQAKPVELVRKVFIADEDLHAGLAGDARQHGIEKCAAIQQPDDALDIFLLNPALADDMLEPMMMHLGAVSGIEIAQGRC